MYVVFDLFADKFSLTETIFPHCNQLKFEIKFILTNKKDAGKAFSSLKELIWRMTHRGFLLLKDIESIKDL